MDIEDLFNENFHIADEEVKDDNHPMVIPEFDPCSGGGMNVDDNISTNVASNNTSNKNG